MKLGEIIVHMDNYNFTKFHQNQSDEKQKKSFINSPFFCFEFQSVSRIMKIVHSALSMNSLFGSGVNPGDKGSVLTSDLMQVSDKSLDNSFSRSFWSRSEHK